MSQDDSEATPKPESVAVPESTPAAAAPAPTIDPTEYEALIAERDALRAEHQAALDKLGETSKEARDRALAMKERQWKAEKDLEVGKYTKQVSALTAKIQELSIESQVRRGAIQWRPEAVDIVLEVTKKYAEIDTKSGDVVLTGVHKGKTLEQFLEAYANDKPFLVASKSKPGTGGGAGSGASGVGHSSASLPDNWDTMTGRDRAQYLLDNPELRQSLKRNK